MFCTHYFLVPKLNKSHYRREDSAIPLYISIRIEFYNGTSCWSLSADCSELIISQKVTSTRKNQSDRIVNEDK